MRWAPTGAYRRALRLIPMTWICDGHLSKSFGTRRYIAATGRWSITEYSQRPLRVQRGLSRTNAAAALAAIRLLMPSPGGAHFTTGACVSCPVPGGGLEYRLSHCLPDRAGILGDSLHCLRCRRRCSNRGINVHPILYPRSRSGRAATLQLVRPHRGQSATRST